MARVKDISVTYARTVNLGNFESMRIDFGECVTLDADDDAETVRAEAFVQVKREVGKQIKAIKEKRGIK